MQKTKKHKFTSKRRKIKNNGLKGIKEMQEYKNYIKVNLPDTSEKETSGNGEGVFILVNDETKKDHDNDKEGGLYFGILDNDSIYFSNILHGAIIPFTMKGNKRPVASYMYLTALNYLKFFTEEEIKELKNIDRKELLNAYHNKGTLTDETVKILFQLATGIILN